MKEMLENWNIYMDCVHVFVRDNAYNIKLGESLLQSTSVPCFIHTIQFIIKYSLFEANNIKVLLAKALKTVYY